MGTGGSEKVPTLNGEGDEVFEVARDVRWGSGGGLPNDPAGRLGALGVGERADARNRSDLPHAADMVPPLAVRAVAERLLLRVVERPGDAMLAAAARDALLQRPNRL